MPRCTAAAEGPFAASRDEAERQSNEERQERFRILLCIARLFDAKVEKVRSTTWKHQADRLEAH